MASVYLYVKNKPTDCINYITICLINEPTMAEYWCLLGDAFFKLKQFHRASAFYENAILFGSQRKNNDPMPIELNKYKEYPEKMLIKMKQQL
jgi:hypothetical protein